MSAAPKGLTLPIWTVAAAKAATEVLLGKVFVSQQDIFLPDSNRILNVVVDSAAPIEGGAKAMAISHCDPGEILDITRGLEIWTYVQLKEIELIEAQEEIELIDSWLFLVAGIGVGKYESTGDLCLSDFALNLLNCNIRKLVPIGYFLQIEIVFPNGKKLAERTSNKAFGVVEGLALIGTTAEVQKSASPDQLQQTIDELRIISSQLSFDGELVFVIGENGRDFAIKLGVPSHLIIKTGNWLGPLLVAAAHEEVTKILLFGYHGKLIKLAGGIFHTHHHLADGRLEILTYFAVSDGLPLPIVTAISKASSMEEALLIVEAQNPELANQLWLRVSKEVEKKSLEYINRYLSTSLEIGSALFDRQRKLRWSGPLGLNQLNSLGIKLFS